MVDPYRMVVVNVIAVAILLISLIIYRYIYPKKNINLIVLLILISILPIISVLRKGVYESGDFTLHIYEAMVYFESLKDGIFIPRWGGDLNATYGYPVFLFTYPLPFYLLSFFHLLGFTYISSMKIFLIISYILSGITMYWMGNNFFGKRGGFVTAVFYLFAPYHLIDLHFRVAIGEVLSFVFMPIIFLFTKSVVLQPKISYFLILAISIALLILSHQAVSLIFFPIAFLFGLVTWINEKNRDIKSIYFLVTSYVTGLLLAAFYWVPVIFEKRYTLDGIFPSYVSFEKFQDFFFSPWRFGFLYQGPMGELSFLIGYIHLIIIGLAILFLFQKKYSSNDKKAILFYLAVFFVLFFLMQSISKPIWDFLPILKNFQFSYRLLAIIAFITAVIAGSVISKIKHRYVVYGILFMVVALTILNWGNRRVIPEISDKVLKENIPYSTAEGEINWQSIPMWVNSNKVVFNEIPSAHLEIIDGDAEIKELKRRPEQHEYLINVKKDSTIKENTLYFPGWKLYINNQDYKINYTNKDYPGVINFKLKKGLYKATLTVEDTIDRKISKIVSLSGFILLILIAIKLLAPKLSTFFNNHSNISGRKRRRDSS